MVKFMLVLHNRAELSRTKIFVGSWCSMLTMQVCWLQLIQILILYFRLRRMGHGWGWGNSPTHRLAKEAAILRLLPQISLIAVPTQGVYKTLPGCKNKVQQRQINQVGYRSIIWTLANTYYLHCWFDHPHNSIDMLQWL